MKSFVQILVFVLLGSISGAASAQGCEYDTQCKGNRICQDGKCVAGDDEGDKGKKGGRENSGDNTSTTCKYNSGPKAGQIQYFPPDTPGLRPAQVGQSCTDGMGSWGVAIPDRN